MTASLRVVLAARSPPCVRDGTRSSEGVAATAAPATILPSPAPDLPDAPARPAAYRIPAPTMGASRLTHTLWPSSEAPTHRAIAATPKPPKATATRSLESRVTSRRRAQKMQAPAGIPTTINKLSSAVTIAMTAEVYPRTPGPPARWL